MQVLDFFSKKKNPPKTDSFKDIATGKFFVMFTLYADVSVITLLLGNFCRKHKLILAVRPLHYLIMIGETVVCDVSLRHTVR